jgi:hypothetical protein
LALSYNKEFKRRFQDSLPGPLFGCVQKSCKRHFRKVRRSVRYGQSLLHKGLPTGPLTITSIIFASPRPPNAQSCLSIFCVRPILLLARLRYSSIALFSFSSPSTHLSTPSRTSSIHKHDHLQVETQSNKSDFVLIHKRPNLAPLTLITYQHSHKSINALSHKFPRNPHSAAASIRPGLLRRATHLTLIRPSSSRRAKNIRTLRIPGNDPHRRQSKKNPICQGGLVHFGEKSMREDDIDHPGISKRARYSHFHF